MRVFKIHFVCQCCLLAVLAGSAPIIHADKAVRLLIIGDSITAGIGLPEDYNLPSQLQAALRDQGHKVDIINGGVSGDTTTGGLARLEWMLSDSPDAVILALGGNDALRAIDPEVTRGNLESMLQRLNGKNIPTLLAGMIAPPNLGPEYAEKFNRIYPELAEAHRVILYPFLIEGVALDPDLNQPDGIHPNQDGVAIIVEKLVPFVDELINLLK